MDKYKEERAKVALMKIESQKNIKQYKLQEHFQNVRLSSLLRIPYTVIKQHNTTHMTVSPINGLMRFQLSDSIPIQKFLQRSDAPTFSEWLQEVHPEESEEYERDKIRFLFGDCKELKRTDSTQKLLGEYDRARWYANENERRYYFSGLLADCDIAALDEFQLFGSVGGHTPEEISDFKSELLQMKMEYEANPSAFFNPVADAPAVPAESVMDAE